MARPRKDIRAKKRSDSERYVVQFVEDPGRWHTSPETSEEEALLWARRNRDRLIAASRPMIRELAKDFFAVDGAWAARMRAKGHHYVDKYLKTRQGHLDNYIVPTFGDRAAGEITRREIDDAMLALQRASGAGKKLAGATLNKILYSFSIFFEELVDRGIVDHNPIDGIRPYDKAPVAPRGAMPREDLSLMFPSTHGELVRVWDSSLWACAFLVMAETGLRPGEVRALRWGDWWPEERYFPIKKGIEAGTTNKERVGGKTGNFKPAFVSTRTKQEIDIWRAESRHADDMDWIFTQTGDAPVTDEGLVKAFRRGLDRLKIDSKGKTPYWLRHSFNTYALEDLDEGEVQRLMGHSSSAMTRHYRHPDDESLLRAGLAARTALDKARENTE